MATPPISYYGGKTRLASRIAAELPPHKHYVEPFAGSLAVLLAKSPSRMETVNDLSSDLMTFWRVLRDQPEEFARVCALTPHSRAERSAALARPEGISDLERARRVWVCLTQGRSGTLRPTGWRYHVDPHGSSISMPAYLRGYLNRMYASAERLASVSLECRPALELIETYGIHPDVCLYIDPPYLASTRTGSNYGTEMASEGEHQELAGALQRCRASVVLSGYDSPLYAELYSGWHATRISTMTGQGGTRQERTEVLWSNREPMDMLPLDGAA